MTIYNLKSKFQVLLRPMVKALAIKGYTPNQITWLALILSIITGGLIAFTAGNPWTLLLMPFVLFIRMALNAIDGLLAKEHDMKTDGGAILNEISDVLSDIALYLPFALISGISPLWVVLFVIAAILTELAGILTWAVKQDRRYDGPMGKSDRAFVMGSIGLLLFLEIGMGIWLNFIFIMITILSLWTTLNRLLKALK